MNRNRYMISFHAIAFPLILSAAIVSAESGQTDRSITIGLRGGAFAPLDQSIQGFEIVTYDVGGSPTGLAISGFGPGGEFYLHAGLGHGDVRLWMLEIGGRLQRRQSEMSLAPNGEWDRYDNELTAAVASLSRIHRFPIKAGKVVPYLGAGIAAQLIRWETLHEPEVGARQWYRGESVVPAIQFAAGGRIPVYYDLFLDTQIRYSYCMGKMRIRNEDAGTETEYHKLNLGGLSLLLGLSIDITPHD
jgi:hypothetical protein